MKSFTNIEQSKKLAEILPLESADMFWLVTGDTPRAHVLTEPLSNYSKWESYPCWSLAALLSVINKTYYVTLLHDGVMWNILVIHHDINKCNHTIHADSPVDACVDMIEKLNELNML